MRLRHVFLRSLVWSAVFAGSTEHPAGRKGYVMARIIDDKMIEYVGILAKLELSEEEKESARKDMGRMLDYIDKLNALDTKGVEPMSHVFPLYNVFREDVVENTDDRENMLANAPQQQDGAFVVPRTIDPV